MIPEYGTEYDFKKKKKSQQSDVQLEGTHKEGLSLFTTFPL